jgi:hypothetical protein
MVRIELLMCYVIAFLCLQGEVSGLCTLLMPPVHGLSFLHLGE